MNNEKWLLLKLSHLGETTSRKILEDNLYSFLGKNCKIFFPYRELDADRYNKKSHVLEGYIFARNHLPLTFYDIERNPYFELVNSKLEYVNDSEVEKLRRKLKEICEEDFERDTFVEIIDGPFVKMTGCITNVEKNDVTVEIQTLSRTQMIKLPKTVLRKI